MTGGFNAGKNAFNAARNLANKARNAKLPKLDTSGKVHGQTPNHVPPKATRDDLKDLQNDLKKSIETRKLEQTHLGEDGPHRNRIREEERFLRQINKALGGS
ncbi:hypothetical protein [Nitrospira lenta]|uniref:Uncharacterized protein n=1 Tax=Nitrospira lenta TaxID=1436998 RepID=A0A330L1B9_9BACT|nr:hypothetical protein [Nitrospira lenta]SPP63520.1 hypothetical protein NITLEN_10606 [Nitrospira lenta]